MEQYRPHSNIILEGFMGSGKSTVGRVLAKIYGMECLDTDALIEDKAGKSISRIFAEDGEAYFRQLETDLLEELSELAEKKIYSLGGGTPLREENRVKMKAAGHVIFLQASADTIYDRVKYDTKRPLLQCDDPYTRIKNMLLERTPKYLEAAELVICVDGKNTRSVIEEVTIAIEQLGW